MDEDATRAPYVPPTADEPLDHIEQALVRALVSAIVAEIREELDEQTTQPSRDDGPERPRLVARMVHPRPGEPCASNTRSRSWKPCSVADPRVER